MSDVIASAAVNDMLDMARAFDLNWDALFGNGAPEPRECAHAMPALVAAGNSGQLLTVFGRHRSGDLIRRQSTDGGHHWGAAIPFPGWIMTSGLAAAAAPDGSHMFLFGRGTDNQIWFAKSADGGKSWQGSDGPSQVGPNPGLFV